MLLLDKPDGLSSNQALQKTKQLLNARKAGHTGSLDPIATGLLPICFGETTKICGLFLHADKTYQVGIRLGVATETGDKEGCVIESRPVDVTEAKLMHVLNRYQGEIEQTPPMYSALKRDGQPLYKLARKGIVVDREPRVVTIHQLTLDGWEEDMVWLTVSCSKGFYVRTLAEDIGRDLTCGAHVVSLRRTQVGEFDLSRSITFDQLEAIATANDRQRLLLPTDQGLAHLPQVTISESLARHIKSGQSVRSAATPHLGLVRVYSDVTGFLGLGEMSADRKLAPKRLFTE